MYYNGITMVLQWYYNVLQWYYNRYYNGITIGITMVLQWYYNPVWGQSGVSWGSVWGLLWVGLGSVWGQSGVGLRLSGVGKYKGPVQRSRLV